MTNQTPAIDAGAACPEWLYTDQNVSDGAVRLYLHLRLRVDAGGVGLPPRAEMAQHLGVSEATVDRRIADLKAAGAITVDGQTGRYSLAVL